MKLCHATVLMLAVLLVAATIPGRGDAVPDATLATISGGSVVYCAYSVADPAAPNGCASCWADGSYTWTVPGPPPVTMTVNPWSRCNASNASARCYTNTFLSDPTPTCDAGLLTNCGPTAAATAYTSSGCTTPLPPASTPPGYAPLCSTGYRPTTPGGNVWGVNCSNVTPGYY
jgi:hypothetical protein